MLRTDFTYELPSELIAQEPRARGESRMMVVDPDGLSTHISNRSVSDLPSLIAPGDVVVLNDTRVFPARLFARPRGNQTRKTELLLTRRIGPARWECWCKPAKRLHPGDVLTLSDTLSASVLEKREDGTVVIDMMVRDEAELWAEIERAGVPPLPPYIRRDAPQPEDRERYQTVYAARTGAIAAPTAGLHFTEELLDAVRARGAEVITITLHVGLGTFKPVKADDVRDHRMESEWYEISDGAAASINATQREGRRVIAIGTTSVRALESAALESNGVVKAGARETSIFITPGFEFKVVDALLTNFHLPESTLLMLVSAFAGVETIRTAYRAAIEERYRFYSYGDCMFLTK